MKAPMVKLAGGLLVAMSSLPSLALATTYHHPNPCLAYQHRLNALGPLDVLRGCLHSMCRENDRCNDYQSNQLLSEALERCDDFLLWHCQLPRPTRVSSGENDFDCSDFEDSEEASDRPLSYLRRYSDWLSFACPENAKSNFPFRADTRSFPVNTNPRQLLAAKIAPQAAPTGVSPTSIPPTSTTNATATTTEEGTLPEPVPVAQEASPSETGGGPNATIIGVAVGGGVCALLIAAVLLAVMVKRRKNNGPNGKFGRKQTASREYVLPNHGGSAAAAGTATTAIEYEASSPVILSPSSGEISRDVSPRMGSSSHGAGVPARRAQSALGAKPVSVVPKPQLNDQLATLQDSPLSSPMMVIADGRPPPLPPKKSGSLALPTTKETVYGDAAASEFATASSV
eukprot:comp12862_c0_seq1/m.8034 comp12862_c0_seq1/g.8034  ORF comp12862_c0_seq1/g.8034 comp12862_c0_seq1/m.8034 type:complete len:399 (-) comp12862_c0_seq1:330-1526(-)